MRIIKGRDHVSACAPPPGERVSVWGRRKGKKNNTYIIIMAAHDIKIVRILLVGDRKLLELYF